MPPIPDKVLLVANVVVGWPQHDEKCQRKSASISVDWLGWACAGRRLGSQVSRAGRPNGGFLRPGLGGGGGGGFGGGGGAGAGRGRGCAGVAEKVERAIAGLKESTIAPMGSSVSNRFGNSTGGGDGAIGGGSRAWVMAVDGGGGGGWVGGFWLEGRAVAGAVAAAVEGGGWWRGRLLHQWVYTGLRSFTRTGGSTLETARALWL